MRFFPIFLLIITAMQLNAKTYYVKKGDMYKYETPSAVADIVEDGDTVLIEAGEYYGDVCVWSANNLTLKSADAEGAKAILIANGKYAQGKGIWVLAGNNTTVEGIAFAGAAVPDKNGAGIRLDGSGLTVRYCDFYLNENGVLAGRKDPNSDILIEHCNFDRNGYGDGYSHNVYINQANSLTFFNNRSHNANIGHNLKSRAQKNYILYNRFEDNDLDIGENGASMHIDLPNGGLSYIIGNDIVQGEYAENKRMISYGAEGLINEVNKLYVVNNTMINYRHTGEFIFAAEGAEEVKAINNLICGNDAESPSCFAGEVQDLNNMKYEADFGLIIQSPRMPYLREDSPPINAGISPGLAEGYDLTPYLEIDYNIYLTAERNFPDLLLIERDLDGGLSVGAHEFWELGAVGESEIFGADAYPNPFSERATIKLDRPLTMKAELSIYSSLGELVRKQEAFAGGEIAIEKGSLAPGAYYFKIIAANGAILKSGAFVVK